MWTLCKVTIIKYHNRCLTVRTPRGRNRKLRVVVSEAHAGTKVAISTNKGSILVGMTQTGEATSSAGEATRSKDRYDGICIAVNTQGSYQRMK